MVCDRLNFLKLIRTVSSETETYRGKIGYFTTKSGVSLKLELPN
jgi:hypothetical protein